MSKYDPLRVYLAERAHLPRMRLTFAEIADVIEGSMPKSAFKYREWWANQSDTANRPQAAAWLSAGFLVESVHQEAATGWVEFVRHSGRG